MINEQIRDREVRLIGADGEQLGIVSSREAQKIADEAGLDLVKIAPNAKPPVCKVIDYGKYRYEQARKEKDAKKKQKTVELKEIRLSPPVLSFLPRVRERKREYFPYLSDAAMENLQWVARSYSNTLPVYIPQPDGLRKGDRIRITEGRFKGVEATVVIQPGAGRKDVMVCVENWMWVPLLRVMPGEYEVIALNDEDKHVYTRLDNDCMLNGLHSALQRYHSAEGVSEEDRSLAARALKEYGNLQMDTDVMRCKLYAILLPAYTILGMEEEAAKLVGVMQTMLPLVKAEQSRALAVVTLYGCTDSSIYYHLAHEAVDPWKKEEKPKKSKQQLINRLDDYDRWLRH